MQRDIRIELELGDSLYPGDEVLLLAVDVEVEDAAVRRKRHRLELVQEPLGKFWNHPAKRHFSKFKNLTILRPKSGGGGGGHNKKGGDALPPPGARV